MSDEFEETYSLSPLDSSDADIDSDGDGYTNLEEYQQGTNPIVAISNSLSMDFVRIPAGTFEMGCDGEDSETGYSCGFNEDPLHTVTITQGFYLQKTEVTQGQWENVMGSNPSTFSSCGNDCPVDSISWNDVQEFITTLNALDDGTYRLPTEAEWEYACRAGTTTAWSFGDDEDQLENFGWYLDNSDVNYSGGYSYNERSIGTHPGGVKSPNDWGLLDMHGNVNEWVQDVHSSYSNHSSEDPVYEGSGSSRVLRGGSLLNSAEGLRCAYRPFYLPDTRDIHLGVRLVITP
ncbi:MAG: formylglycine-generating enzyme family protein [Magnetococcales bacterium]|nr:formylglycine-generating enzyme family protein [Magnetococcales bacterium]